MMPQYSSEKRGGGGESNTYYYSITSNTTYTHTHYKGYIDSFLFHLGSITISKYIRIIRYYHIKGCLGE